MKENKVNIILIIVCVLLCTCLVWISMVIPKHIIKISNDEATVKYGENKYFVYGDTFYATIEKIENNEKNICIKGLEVNDANHRGKYHFLIDDDTKLFWRYKEIRLTDLKEGQTISITSTGTINKRTGFIYKVAIINLLDDKIENNLNEFYEKYN